MNITQTAELDQMFIEKLQEQLNRERTEYLAKIEELELVIRQLTNKHDDGRITMIKNAVHIPDLGHTYPAIKDAWYNK